MKIYFAGSIRGGGGDPELFKQIITYLQKYGEIVGGEYADQVLASNVTDGSIDDEFISNRDSQRLTDADVLVAEITSPSHGVGYEIGRCVEMKKRIICLYQPKQDRKVSALIAGNQNIKKVAYTDLKEARHAIDKFFSITP